MENPCPKPDCGETTRTIVLTPDLQHYGKITCAKCGRFFGWAPKPKPSNVRFPVGLDETDILPDLTIGSSGQIAAAKSIRASMLKRLGGSPEQHKIAAMRTISDATWWLANQGRDIGEISWPVEWSKQPVSSNF